MIYQDKPLKSRRRRRNLLKERTLSNLESPVGKVLKNNSKIPLTNTNNNSSSILQSYIELMITLIMQLMYKRCWITDHFQTSRNTKTLLSPTLCLNQQWKLISPHPDFRLFSNSKRSRPGRNCKSSSILVQINKWT